MGKTVEIKRERITICTYKDLAARFRQQSIKMNESVSRRIENFMIKELEKEKKNEN